MEKDTIEQLEKDIEFLIKRGQKRTLSYRDTGLSSDSIVNIAYGYLDIYYQKLPSDISDMRSCENMWDNLPDHRKKGNGLLAMEAARNCNYNGKRNKS